MGQQKFRGPLLFLFAEHSGAAEGREEGPAHTQHVAALDGVVAGQAAEVQPVHAEGRGEGAHGGKDLVDLAHLALHLGKEENADRQQKGDGPGPDQQGVPAPAQLMLHDGHLSPPPFS